MKSTVKYSLLLILVLHGYAHGVWEHGSEKLRREHQLFGLLAKDVASLATAENSTNSSNALSSLKEHLNQGASPKFICSRIGGTDPITYLEDLLEKCQRYNPQNKAVIIQNTPNIQEAITLLKDADAAISRKDKATLRLTFYCGGIPVGEIVEYD